MARAKYQRRRTRRGAAMVVDLSSVRAQRRREQAEERVRDAMDENRAALSRLFASGLIFTQKGARAGRDLLLAHQALLRTADLFARLVEPSARDDAALKHRAEEVFAHLDSQLARTAQLTARTGEFLSGRGRD
ncbi:MAG: hypothetical protein E6J84_10175 [Deltaproteobacteria bacterium]|nr:MAG: hypothetical protein E6J86_08790 [Deltaproteobacteria bacterium]TMA15304.1 MAG: hypothetical protein E6J84_10175 [Deltaproteobacteria bacterium]TMA45560.1 MAG: hypothetical protein E6J82_01800 [Deltaproteobacteria bacterium]TMA73934.1 MAG: hypothetical protein E6J67_14060 [Deltaproteobacteria bacterium]TMB40521.1 MAG: hypothetical protein E6J58_05225 [Deltaproteobacteria bacterium]